MVGSFTTCCEGWPLAEDGPGPLPRPNLRLTAIFVAIVAVGLIVAWAIGSRPPSVATLGEDAPDFTVELIDGGTFTLSKVEGPVVLNFWASWCGPCRTEIPDVSAYADTHPEVTVIGVTAEDQERASREFAAEIDATYPLALGNDVTEDAYPRLGLPATYIIRDGVVVEVFNGVVTEEILSELVD